MSKREPKTTTVSLRSLRESLGLTQEDVAAASGMQQSEVSRLERRGDYHISTLRRIVSALGGRLEIVARLGKKRIPLD